MGDQSQNPYDRLLAWLDDDPKRALVKYGDLRKELIDFFRWRFCDDPENLANRTIDSVATSIVNLKTLPPNPNRYFFAVARRIYRDYLRRDKPFAHENTTSFFYTEFSKSSFDLDRLFDFEAQSHSVRFAMRSS